MCYTSMYDFEQDEHCNVATSSRKALEELSLRLSRLHHHLPFEVGKVAAR